MDYDFILGRSPYQNRARINGICSNCYRNPVQINPKTGLYKWRCDRCEKKLTRWRTNYRRKGNK